MNKRFPRLALSLDALVFIATGGVFLLIPIVPLNVLGIKEIPGLALTDIRAIYGGLEIAIGGYLLRCAYVRSDVREPIQLCIFLFLGLIVARLYGFAVDGSFGKVNGILIAAEILGLGVNGIAYRVARNDAVK